MFIRDLSGALVSCPILESLLSPSERKAFAQGSSVNKRFIAIQTPNQSGINAFRPTNFVDDVISADLAPHVQSLLDRDTVPYRQLDLAEVVRLTGRISRVLDEKFNPFASKMATYYGTDYPGRTDHGSANMLGNIGASVKALHESPYDWQNPPANWVPYWQPMMTADEFIADSTNFYSQGRNNIAADILRLGEMSLSTNSISNTGNPYEQGAQANAALTYGSNPQAIFDNLIAASAVPRDVSQTQQSAVNRILTHTNAISNMTTISSADKQVLERYMDELNELEQRLSADVPAISCSIPNFDYSNLSAITNWPNNNNDLGNRSDAATIINAFYDHLVQLMSFAIRCNITNVITLGVGSTMASPSHPWAHSGDPRLWHLEGAHGWDDEYMTSSIKWVMDRILFPLLQALEVEESNNQTFLDNTLIWFQPECSTGHSGINMSGVLVGNTQGVNTGKFYDFCDWQSGNTTINRTNARTGGQNPALRLAPGIPYNRMLVGILQSLGLTESDYINKFGNGGSGFGIWENYGDGFEQYFSSVIRDHFLSDPLPGLF